MTRRFRITVNGKVFEVEAEELGGVETPVATVAPVKAPSAPVAASAPSPTRAAAGASTVDAPLPGLVLDVKVSAGDVVTEGQILVILEAMKMENEIVASQDGVVESVNVAKGDNVSSGDVLVVIK